eukprot:2808024-Rhodomonas_salina.1
MVIALVARREWVERRPRRSRSLSGCDPRACSVRSLSSELGSGVCFQASTRSAANTAEVPLHSLDQARMKYKRVPVRVGFIRK